MYKNIIYKKIIVWVVALLLIGEVFFPMLNAQDTLINYIGGALLLLTIILTIKFTKNEKLF